MSILFKNVLRKIAAEPTQQEIDKDLSTNWGAPYGYRDAVINHAMDNFKPIPGRNVNALGHATELENAMRGQGHELRPGTDDESRWRGRVTPMAVEGRNQVTRRMARNLAPIGTRHNRLFSDSARAYGAAKARYFYNNGTLKGFPIYDVWVNDPANKQPGHLKKLWNNVPVQKQQLMQRDYLNFITRNGGGRGNGFGIV